MSAIKGMPEGVRVFNYTKSQVKLPNAEDIPVLLPDAVKNELMRGDDAPYFKVEAIDYPARGTGGIYEKSFFQSFINVCKERPIPGSKRGHEWTSRPSSDFYMVGGSLVDNGDKTGTAFFLMYFPPQGDTTSNDGFIRDARAGIVNFSLVSSPEYKVMKGEGGQDEVHFTRSAGYERNDAVEFGAGAMKQVVNSKFPFDIEAAKALINSGQIDRETDIEGSVVQNGKVYRSALRRLVSRASNEDKPELTALLSAFDRKHNELHGGKTVDKIEAMDVLKNCVLNGQTNLGEIAAAVGLSAKVRNEDDEKNAETVRALNSKLGEKPLEKLETILAENAKSAQAILENQVADYPSIGAKRVKNAEGEDVDNPVFVYALMKCQGKKGDEVKASLDALKDDPIMKNLLGARADSFSAINTAIQGGGAGPQKPGAVRSV
jgi:hypothetical protein